MSNIEEFSSAAVLKKARLYIAEKRNLEYIKKSENTIKEFLQNGFTTKEVILFYKNEIGVTIPLSLLEKYIEEKEQYFYKDIKKKKTPKNEKAKEEKKDIQKPLDGRTTALKHDGDASDSSTHQSENIKHGFNDTQKEKNYAS